MNSMPLGDILSLSKCMQRDFVFVRIPNGMRKLTLLSFSTELESLWDFFERIFESVNFENFVIMLGSDHLRHDPFFFKNTFKKIPLGMIAW